MGPGGLLGYTAGAANDLASEEVTDTQSGVATCSYDEFPTLSLPPGLINKQGYKVTGLSWLHIC